MTWYSPYTEEKNRMTLWIPGRQSTVIPDAPDGLLYPGDKGVHAGLIPTFKKAFAPRVGIAWDPTGSGNWLITSAYGIFYEPYYTGQGGPLQSPISAPPFLQTEQINLDPPPTPPLNFQDPYRWQSSCARHVCHTAYQPDAGAESCLCLTRRIGTSTYRGRWASDLLFEVGYVGTKGTKLPRFIEANPTVYIPEDRSTSLTTSTSGAFTQDAR